MNLSYKKIIAVKYLDAFYITRNEFKIGRDTKLDQHITLGRLFVDDKKKIGISFEDHMNKPQRGLILPLECLVDLNLSPLIKEDNFHLLLNRKVGFFWTDIVYFENGVIPNESNKMYTEGKVIFSDSRLVVIEKPETLKLKREGAQNHPDKKPKYYVIPKVLIKEISTYE